MHSDYVYEDMLMPRSPIVYTKRTSVIWVDVELLEWIFHRFVVWYMNIKGELVGPLEGFDSNNNELMGELIYP